MQYNFIPEDFAGNSYGSNTDCPIARLYKREMGVSASASGHEVGPDLQPKTHIIGSSTLNGAPIQSEEEATDGVFNCINVSTIQEAIENGTFESATIELIPINE